VQYRPRKRQRKCGQDDRRATLQVDRTDPHQAAAAERGAQCDPRQAGWAMADDLDRHGCRLRMLQAKLIRAFRTVICLMMP
jgi:hypothetical protein